MASKAPKGRITISLIVIAAVADVSSFHPGLDLAICGVMLAGMSGVLVYSVGWWFGGEWWLGQKCRRPVVHDAHEEPVSVQPRKDKVDG